MYKLLTTAAVIMTVATPSIANQWTGHKDVVNKLNGIYTNLDGGSQFDDLQGAYDENAEIGSQTGQLSNFFDLVDKGVTYITLTVDPDTNAITPGINPGVAFSEITGAKDELVQRVNYDLFVSDTDEAVTGFDRTNTTYTDVRQQNLTITGTPENSSDNGYESNHNGGLAGVKIKGLVDNVNAVNNFLIAGDTSASQSKTFQEEFADGLLSTNTQVVDIFSDINDLNEAIALGQDNDVGGDNFFGNINLGAVSETNINDFAIPAYNSFDSIGDPLNSIGYTSISAWASGVHTVVVADGSSTIKTDGTVVITDSVAGTVTVSGSTDSTDGTYTFNTTTDVFDKT